MKTQSEINQMLEKLFTAVQPDDETKYNRAAIAGQALAWVLGDEMSPLDMLNDE